MAGTDLARADLLAGPIDTDTGIEPASEILEVARRALAEDDIQHPVVGVVGRAHHDPTGAGVRQRRMDDLGFSGRQVRHIAPCVVEEDRKVVDADLVEGPDLGEEVRLRRTGVVSIQLVGAQAHAEPHAEASAVRRQIRQLGKRGWRVSLAPAPPQKRIRLRRMVKPRKAEYPQLRDHELAILVAPRSAEISFDDTQFRNHAPGLHRSRRPGPCRLQPSSRRAAPACRAWRLRSSSSSRRPRASMQVPHSPTSPLRSTLPSMSCTL